ncbi:MAG TPA: trigger factor [Anaerolineae bacterium]|nr:trigger factor [Anaerolineae bacterium]
MFEVTGKQILDTHEAVLAVEIDPETVETAKRAAAKTLAQKINIPGFRKGAAPYQRIVRYVGEQALLQEAADQLINDIYPQIIEKAAINPYGPGELQDLKLAPMSFEIKVPLEPTVTLGDYRSLRKEWQEVGVSDEEVAAILEQFREEHAVLEPVDRPADMGDEVNLNVHGAQDDELIIDEHDIAVQLDVKRPFLSLEFVQALVGMSAQEKKELTLTLPEDMEEEDLRGATVDLEVTVNQVYTRALPELDDALASTVGAFETLEDLKADIRQRMGDYKQHQARETYRNALIQELIEHAQIQYPQALVQDTLDDLVKETEERIKRENKISLEDVLRLQGQTMEWFRTQMLPRAETRIKNSLVLSEFARREQITADEDEVVHKFNEIMTANGLEDPTISDNVKIDSPLGQHLFSTVLEEKTLERLEQIARGEYVAPASEDPAAEPTDAATAAPTPDAA